MVKSPNILAVGGAHIDRRGQVSGPYVPAASNPGTMREDVGGGVFNALRGVV
ncbi:MAG: carbohydrate kinase, partial [Mesorhizobium sp.]